MLFSPRAKASCGPHLPCPPAPLSNPALPSLTSYHHERPRPANEDGRRPSWSPTYSSRYSSPDIARIFGRIFAFPSTFLPPTSKERWRPTRSTRIQQQYQHQQPIRPQEVRSVQQEALTLIFRQGCRRRRPGCRRRQRRRGRPGGGTQFVRQTKQKTTHILLVHSFPFALLVDVGAGRSLRLYLAHPPLRCRRRTP